MAEAENQHFISSKTEPFNPNNHQENLLEAFNNFVSTYHYIYDAVAKDPPSTVQQEDAKKEWHELNKRKIFLGRYSSRELQQEYEECVQEEARTTMTSATW